MTDVPMLADSIQAKFPEGTGMPDDLRRLCAFAEEHGNPVSGCFELVPDTAKAWFGDAQAASRFAVFGSGPEGSLVALWLYRDMDPAQAPVVSLGSEGDENIVLVPNVREFLRLLGVGYSELGPSYVEADPDDPDSASDLRAWLADEFGIEPPPTAFPILAEARRLHPDLVEWIRALQRRREPNLNDPLP